jgi:pantoate--beta-alanine ligase
LHVDAIWAPGVATMYPEGFATKIVPGGPALTGLEDKFRPHFFGGVCTVVAKLLLQVSPQFATFGEKDYQQLKVVTAMTRDLGIPTKIIGLPTVREKDGLAMSSRNAYLSADERAVAPTLYRVLRECARRLNAGSPLAATLAESEEQIAHAGFAVDYLEARHAETLAPVTSRKDGPLRLLVAAKLGRTRLIDNIGV